jgi:hypothetical protein
MLYVAGEGEDTTMAAMGRIKNFLIKVVRASLSSPF